MHTLPIIQSFILTEEELDKNKNKKILQFYHFHVPTTLKYGHGYQVQ